MSYPRKIAIVHSICSMFHVEKESSLASEYPQSGGTFIEQVDDWVFKLTTKSRHGDATQIFLTRETAAELIAALRKITG